MAMRDKIEHAIQNQPCTVKDLKSKFGGDRGSDRKVMEAVDQLVHEAVICQRQGPLLSGLRKPAQWRGGKHLCFMQSVPTQNRYMERPL